MWVLTNVGYVCAVVHKEDLPVSTSPKKKARDRIMIRARARRHLETLFPHQAIIEWPDADFRYRVVISRAAFKNWLANQVDLMDYDSFKHSTEDERLYKQYVAWWQIGLDYQRAQEQAACEHEWEMVNDSFDHEFGTEKVYFDRCLKCDAERKNEPFTYGDEA